MDDSRSRAFRGFYEVTADSDYEVTFKLKEAMYPDTFLQDIDTVFIIPKHIFEGKTAEEINAPDLWANPVGSGHSSMTVRSMVSVWSSQRTKTTILELQILTV